MLKLTILGINWIIIYRRIRESKRLHLIALLKGGSTKNESHRNFNLKGNGKLRKVEELLGIRSK
jgi:hypothetical protein